MKRGIALVTTAVLAVGAVAALAAVFQYSVPVPIAKGQSAAYLWIPPTAKQVRGVVIGGMTLMEREFVKDEQIRNACAKQQLAIVVFKCGLGGAEMVQKALYDLARVSGHKELSVARCFSPVIRVADLRRKGARWPWPTGVSVLFSTAAAGRGEPMLCRRVCRR